MADKGRDEGLSDAFTSHPSPRRWLVLALCSTLFIISQFYRVANAVIAPELQRDLSLSSEALGLVSAAFFYAFALAQLPLGPCLDRFGPRSTMTILSLTGTLGAWIFATAHDSAFAIVGRTLLGLGMAGNLMGSMVLLTAWFSPREFATLSGLIFSMGTLGNMLAATPLALLAADLGWRWSFMIIGALTAGATFVFFVLVRDAPRDGGYRLQESVEGQEAFSVLKKAGLLLGRWEYWLISLGTFFRYGTFVAIQGLWAGPYLMDVLDLSPVLTGNLLLLLNVGLVLGAPIGGWLSDQVLDSRKWVILVGLAAMAFAELGLAQGWGRTQLWALGGILFLLGFSSGFGVVMYAHIKEIMPRQMTGMAITGINLFTMLGGAVFLHLMGMVLDLWASGPRSDAQGYRAAFLMTSGGVTLAFLLYLLTRDVSPAKAPRGGPAATGT